ncbi:hypothetical protein Hamer_G024102, partial [Homarus americanus]
SSPPPPTTSPPQPPSATSPTTTPTAVACYFNGVTWDRNDDCNWCGCRNGFLTCTELDCEDNKIVDCIPGSIFFNKCYQRCACPKSGIRECQPATCISKSRKSRDLSSAPTPSPGNFNNTEVVVCIPESVYLNHCGRKCTCSSQGRFVCDPDRCRAETEVEGQVCDHVYLLLDECNWCMCVNGRITCTHDTCVTTNHSNYHNQPAFSTTNHPNYGYTSDLTTTNHSNYHNQPALTTTNHPNYHNSPALTTTNQSTSY